MDKKAANAALLEAVKNSRGIVEVAAFLSEDRKKIMDIETDAEERSLMGLGKVINTGVREVLNCELIYVALNNMDFWLGTSCHPGDEKRRGGGGQRGSG